ncbi:MAG TPA: hypothetical protein VGQ65_14750 [Thermoanaerobaculia bacterium]|jgi:hypothetical protein|nr:hypothetical protein [Thermoanaerobaculia bacterium]
MKKAFTVFLFAVALAGASLVVARQSGGSSSSGLNREIPMTPPAPNQAALDRYSWESFIALNQVALLDTKGRPVRDPRFPNGVSDPKKNIGDSGPRVWEGLKADYELFQDKKGANPAPWTDYDYVDPCSGAEFHGAPKALSMIAKGNNVITGAVNQAMGGPLVDQFGRYVRYEVRSNELYYTYVASNQLYIRDELDKKHRWPKPAVKFPISIPTENKYGALEVKAAWKVLDEKDDASRYYTTEAVIFDPKTHKCGQPQTLGMVGLHILQKVSGFNSWIWSTFEHVDNVPCDAATQVCAPPPPNGLYAFATAADAVNPPKDGYKPDTAWRPVAAAALPSEPAPKTTVVRVTPLPKRITDLNAEMQALTGIRGTVWEHYQLIDTQWPVNGGGAVVVDDPRTAPSHAKYETNALKPAPLDTVANTSMESFYQLNTNPMPSPAPKNKLAKTFGSSCMQCHYFSAQYDFSWTLPDQSYPPSRAALPKQ